MNSKNNKLRKNANNWMARYSTFSRINKDFNNLRNWFLNCKPRTKI